MNTTAWSVVMLLAMLGQTPSAPGSTIEVYKTSSCECCRKWVEHLTAHGFVVRTTDVDDLDPVQQRFGVPIDVRSCHSAMVGGYVIEGHVPAAEIRRLLKERPAAAGLAVPSMPPGAPGMEVASGKTWPYRVLAFNKDGTTRVFALYRGSQRSTP